MSKYQPLADHLAGLSAKSCTLTFDGIERIIGSKLPRSAWGVPSLVVETISTTSKVERG